MKILAVESSHDDTSVVLYENKKVIKELSFTQTEFHKQFGGTVPEFASRGHFDRFPKILEELNKDYDLSTIDHVAYTAKPGLIGSLHVGTLFAKGVALALGKEAKPINHMFGHIYAVSYTEDIIYPAIALVVSGGHTQIWHVKSVEDIECLGQTKDDAVGEVYDKVARKMGLGFPGGPVIDRMAYEGERVIDFKLKDDKTYDFSFSGMKTKIINYVHNKEQKGEDYSKEDVCASFQESVVEILMKKTTRAIEEFKPASIVLGGGVSANSYLRSEFAKLHENALIPAMRFTTDNAMMIAIRSHIKEEYNEKNK